MEIIIFILKKKNITDFAGERNRLLEKAKGDWLFFVDSDEKIGDRLKNEIENLNPGKFSGFYIKRKNYFLGQFVGTDKIIRLVKKGTGKWERAVHETWKTSHPAGVIKTPLRHNTAENLYEYLTKINNYSTLHALANKKEGKRSSIFKICFYPPLKFIQTYLKSRHFVFSLMQAFHSFLAWSKLYVYQSKK